MSVSTLNTHFQLNLPQFLVVFGSHFSLTQNQYLRCTKSSVKLRLKGLSHLVQSCLLYRSCMSKDSARSTGHVDHFFPIKYCVACKKSTLKVLINLGFVTSFEDSHYILLFRYIYGAQLTQWFCYSKHLHVNRDYRPNGTATSLSPKCYSANVPLDFCTTADFEMK